MCIIVSQFVITNSSEFGGAQHLQLGGRQLVNGCADKLGHTASTVAVCMLQMSAASPAGIASLCTYK